jgi:alpha-tubulin suppressor-like RCC1 family protein
MNLALSGKYPIQISAGNYLASVVTSDGGLYNWGALYFIDPVSSADVRYGIGDNSNPAAGTRNPTKVAIDVSNKFILSNNVGYTGANCLASDHFSYGYGEGQYGQVM